MRLPLERIIFAAFVIGFAVFATSAWFAVKDGRAYLESEQRILRINETLLALEQMLGNLRDAETGQRGYLLTGEAGYLEPYFRTVRHQEELATYLRDRLDDDPQWLPLLDEMDSLRREKMTELAFTIHLRNTKGLEVAMRVVDSHQGKELMDRLRVVIGLPYHTKRDELRQEIADSKERASQSRFSLMLFGGMTLLGLIGTYWAVSQEIRSKRALGDRLAHEATHDALTGLPNRRYFMDWLVRLGAQSGRRGRPLALLFIDLDGFKAVNDRFGHEAGDAMLKEVALRFRRLVRESDVLARLAGDEFAVLMPEVASAQDAARLAQRLIDSLGMSVQRPLLADCPDARVGASIGIAMAVGGDPDQLVAEADEAMYAAKAAGKNCYRQAPPRAER
ncbi:diguanylate cyclase [Oryzomicrobium sp.]|uniref:diguanylate cyclase domain-containing protein n=1 Tax=Oryzomicrobium sp. TaxID=1911578 RepID=UPI0025E89C96|nr:diguanylate cyclase [Oryzomicrobium sp.]MCE1244282.1 diguanylate cyclase [Oryzomicrobium sp.]